MSTRNTVYERLAPPSSMVSASLAGSRADVFWLDDCRDAATFEPLAGRRTTDLAVVGGGYAGLWTALLAKRRHPGTRVMLLEAKTIGWAASGRNGGFVDASLTHGEPNGRTRWEHEYDDLQRLGTANLDGLADDVASLGLDCQFERTGMLEVAVEPHQVDWARETTGTFLDRDAVRAQINSPIFLAGVLDSDSTALVHPGRLAHELARVASELGVEIHEHTRVTAIESERTGGDRAVTLRTEAGSVVSDRVALGTNVFPSLIKRTRLFTVPVYDYVLMTEPLTSDQLASIGWTGRQGLGDMANQFHYLRLSGDNRILIGGYDAIYRYGRQVRPAYEHRPESHRRLAAHFFTLFPQLEGVRFSHRWAGAIDTSTQFCAFHGLARQGRVAYAAGFTGLGVGATRFAAEVMLDRLAGESTPRTAVTMVKRMPLPFPPEPIASVGINLTRHSLDRADHREGERNLLLRALDKVGLGFDS